MQAKVFLQREQVISEITCTLCLHILDFMQNLTCRELLASQDVCRHCLQVDQETS